MALLIGLLCKKYTKGFSSMIYTEENLKKLKIKNKTDLTALATAHNIEVEEGTTNGGIIELIVKANLPVSDEHKALLEEKPNDPPIQNPDTENAPKFTKDQILAMHWYSHKRNLLAGKLKDGETYSYSEIEKLISK
jgi:hypothetical protein